MRNLTKRDATCCPQTARDLLWPSAASDVLLYSFRARIGAPQCSGPVTVDIIGAGDLLVWSWAFPPYVWHFDARALEPTEVIFFNGTLLREYCERAHALGYELFKRISKVMMLRLQRARLCILADRVEGEPEAE
jgi:hypothetical protein